MFANTIWLYIILRQSKKIKEKGKWKMGKLKNEAKFESQVGDGKLSSMKMNGLSVWWCSAEWDATYLQQERRRRRQLSRGRLTFLLSSGLVNPMASKDQAEKKLLACWRTTKSLSCRKNQDLSKNQLRVPSRFPKTIKSPSKTIKSPLLLIKAQSSQNSKKLFLELISSMRCFLLGVLLFVFRGGSWLSKMIIHEQIDGTRAKSQQIVVQRLLSCLQHPVPY